VTDLLVIVPSRGRPANVERLVRACAMTCRADTLVYFGFDADDSDVDDNVRASDGALYDTGPRDTLTGWTNKIAREHGCDMPYLASIGDDMVPATDGWDEQLLAVLEENGPGFAYPNDLRRTDIPEAVVISRPIVDALGWMSPPFVTHWYQDNVWADLGRAAGCLHYLPGVIVDHRHPNVTGEPADATYYDAARKFAADLAAYQRWRLKGMAADVARVRAARAAA
jgi:hypothetical protein